MSRLLLALLLAAPAAAAGRRSYEAVCRDLLESGHDSAAAVCARCAELFPASKACKAAAAKARPQGGNLLVTLCETSWSNGDVEKARDFCGQCVGLDPENKACAAVLKKLPKPQAMPLTENREATQRYVNGRLFYDNKDFAGARREWEACLRVEPGNHDCTEALKRLQETR